MTSVDRSYSYANHSICVTSPAPRSVWKYLLRKDPNVLPTQTPDWLDCICAAGNFNDASRLYEIPGRGAFVLPMVRSKNMPAFIASLYSPPYSWGMGGLVGEVPVQEQDVNAVVKDLIDQPGLRKLIRPNPLTNNAWKDVQGYGVMVIPRQAHVLDLEGGFSLVWSSKFSTNTRRNVRKAESSGLVIECDLTGKLVPVFYKLFKQSVDRWADRQNEPRWLAHLRANHRDPITKFEIITKRMKAACRVWVAWYQNEPAAAILVLQDANAHYTRGAMNVEIAGPTRANDLLHRYAIEDACNSGCRHYHMGESGQSASLARFKCRFGAEAISYAEYHIECIPITAIDQRFRSVIKKAIRFRDE